MEPTGAKEKVNGIDCEIFTWSQGSAKGRYWVAPKHPQAALLKDLEKKMREGALGQQAGPDTSKLPGPILKTETEVMGMKTVATVTSIKEEAVADSEFQAPAGYKEMAMPQMPK